MKVIVHIDPDPLSEGWLITVRPIRGWLWRMLKLPISEKQYSGACTVFHNVATGKRPGTRMEMWLSEQLWKHKWENKDDIT